MDDYREEIKGKLLPVSEKGRILFAVLVCERLYPNYVAFEKIVEWGNHEALLEGISLIRQALFKRDIFEASEIEGLIEQVDSITPSTEKFSGITTSFALDACTSILSTLNYMLDKDIENVVDVATYARDTVDMFVQEKENLSPNDPKLEEKIASDPFMLREKNRQRDLLKKLAIMNLDNLSDKVVESLKDSSPIIDLQLLPTN